MTNLVLPDQPGLIGLAAATLLVAAAAVLGAMAPSLGRWLAARALEPANDNDEGFVSPRSRLRAI